MTTPVPDVRTYGDFAGLESLKKSTHANDPAAIREVARQFESLFARMLIKSMRNAIGRDPIFGSDQEETYQSMFDDQLSLELTRGHGLGLADMLVRQLQRRGLTGASAGGSAAQAGAAGGAGSGTSATGASGASPSSGVPAASKTEQTSFIREVWPQAQQAGSALGVDPTSLVAQAALETDWGRSVPRDANGRSSHNLFGVKASGEWNGSSVSSTTQEFQGGAVRATTAEFRAYSSPAESFQDYVALLQNDPRYATALNTGGNVAAFAQALQRGGYATDPDYARKVSAVASQVATTVGALKFADAQPINPATGTLL
jgi:peptidoglycan hydrolase FlgJ